ncbi:transcription factor grauzone [Drosophila tropicalis]|uniref:transcription factor grauzone n=1 Tax=Drosophila tropicalis TaxID=46794 RepID=UPI0035ABE425
MICRLCLNTASDEDIIHIFDSAGQSINVASILAKYFWFEPKSDDPISTVICVSCWKRVNDFHEFYVVVEKAHRLLTERFSFKNELKANSNSLNEIDTESGTDGGDGHHVVDDNDDFFFQNTDYEDCGNDDSFSNEQFLNDVLKQTDITEDQDPTETDTLDFKDVPIITEQSEQRRETRSVAKSKAEAATTKKSLDVAPAKKRGRHRKVAVEVEETVQKEKRYKNYKNAMKEIDQKIAAHMRLTCDICHEGQETFLKLCKHMLQAHHKKGYAICCNKKFYKRSFLTDHIDRHANPDKFKCQECGKTFADKQCLRNHELLKHQPDEEKTFMCENCPKRYTKQYLLDQHRIIHKERNVPCDICERRFPNVSLLSSHVKMVHGNYGTMCDICAQVIRGRAAFQRHQLEHAGITEPKVQCDICGSWHKNKYSLRKHIRRHQSSYEECTCNICGKVSPNRSAMLSHQRYVHMLDRKHECSVCNKAFKKAITLKEHMTMHTGEVLYQCPHCPKTFNSNANKHSHRKKCHPKEFEEARKARSEKRMSSTATNNTPSATSSTSIITIESGEGETQNILLTTTSRTINEVEALDGGEPLKAENLEFTICLSSQEAV